MQRKLFTLCLFVLTILVLSGGPASFAGWFGLARPQGVGKKAAALVQPHCEAFFRGGTKLLRGGAITTADDLSTLTGHMHQLDHLQKLSAQKLTAYDHECRSLIASGQLQNEERLTALGEMGQAAIDTKERYGKSYEKMAGEAQTLKHDLNTRRLRAFDQLQKARVCNRDLKMATEMLQRDYERFQGHYAGHLGGCGDPGKPSAPGR